MFQMYARNLRRVFWAEFIDVQVHLARAHDVIPPIVAEPVSTDGENGESLVPTYEYYRHRTTPQA